MRQWRERKCPIFDTVAKQDSNPGSLDCESGILPLSYRAPHKVKNFVYLGGNVSGNGRVDVEVRRRIQAGANARRNVEEVMREEVGTKACNELAK